MAYGTMTVAPLAGAIEDVQRGTDLHPIMGLIAAKWPNFGNGKTPQQKKAMIAVWEKDLSDIPISLQRAALDKKIKSGQMFPPSSPAEVRNWCNEIQKPMDALDAKFYADMAELEILDADFCAKQTAKYKAGKDAGRNAYAGWD